MSVKEIEQGLMGKKSSFFHRRFLIYFLFSAMGDGVSEMAKALKACGLEELAAEIEQIAQELASGAAG